MLQNLPEAKSSKLLKKNFKQPVIALPLNLSFPLRVSQQEVAFPPHSSGIAVGPSHTIIL